LSYVVCDLAMKLLICCSSRRTARWRERITQCTRCAHSTVEQISFCRRADLWSARRERRRRLCAGVPL